MKATKKTSKKPLVILTAGGTGGHVYPAEALAEELEGRGYRLMLVTDCRGKDNYKGRLGQIPNRAVMCGSIVGRSKWFKLKSLAKTCVGIVQAVGIILKDKPACVVGFGGYASFPASVAAILTGAELVIHEQNSVMSRTNRFLSRYATLIAKSFKKTKYAPARVKTVLTGMPVRANIVACSDREYNCPVKDEVLELLVLGGSQGAKVFGEVLPAAVKALPTKEQQRLKIFQQCRQGEEEMLEQAYEGAACAIEIRHFFEDMAGLYSKIHLIISRAGASSVSEIAVAGVPSVLVPLPTAADDHQSSNAAEIGEAKAGIVIRQKDFTVEKVQQLLEDILSHPQQLAKMSANAKAAGIKDAAKRLADEIEKLISQNKN